MEALKKLNLHKFHTPLKIFLIADLILLAYLIITGLPPHWGEHFLQIKMKNFKGLFTLLILSGFGLAFCHKDGPEKGFSSFKEKIIAWTSKPDAIWILFAAASVIFTWQQMTEYLALEINVMPFSFYDYMLYYFFEGKINYTELLHKYYHFNNILYFLAPLWALVKSPLLLITIYGPLAALAIFPLYSMAKYRFQSASFAFLVAFVYLNYRYLQNVLRMNFSIEILYPLFIFAIVVAALKERRRLYYLFLFLGLMVKEDSFIYFSAIGMLVFFLEAQKGKWGKGLLHGSLTIFFSMGYFIFLKLVLGPLTDNGILERSAQNYEGYGDSMAEILKTLFANPANFIVALFGTEAKINTLFKLVSRLAFLPLFSPVAVFILVPILPLFLHNTGRDADFFELRFHYAAAVIPFVFIAFVFGFSNLSKRLKGSSRPWILTGFILALLLMNSGHFRTEPWGREDLRSIGLARSLPQGTNVVTHGHLLPYLGYRRYNYFFAQPWEEESHPAYEPYHNADYYLFDSHVNPYPMDKSYFDQKRKELGENPRYKILYDDGKRILIGRKQDVR